MYAQRFGALPIGHSTGGLAETISDGKSGILFRSPSVEGLLGAACRAFSIFGSKRRLNEMRCNAMARAFSWHDAARSYDTLYRRIAS
jgi:starch synthase